MSVDVAGLARMEPVSIDVAGYPRMGLISPHKFPFIPRSPDVWSARTLGKIRIPLSVMERCCQSYCCINHTVLHSSRPIAVSHRKRHSQKHRTARQLNSSEVRKGSKVRRSGRNQASCQWLPLAQELMAAL